jgi:DNA repair photolyase
MIGAAIGAGLSIASAIAGGISSAKKNREARALQEQERRRNREWYDAEMAKDYTMRADYQNVLRRQREMYNERLNNLAASQAVTPHVHL